MKAILAGRGNEKRNEGFFGRTLVDTNSCKEIINESGYPVRQIPSRFHYWQGSQRESRNNYHTMVYFDSHMYKMRRKIKTKHFEECSIGFSLINKTCVI